MSAILSFETYSSIVRDHKLENLIKLARKSMDHAFTEYRLNSALFYLDISCILEIGTPCTSATYRATKRSVVLDGLAESMVAADFDDSDVDVRSNSEYERFVFSSISRSMKLMSESEIFEKLISKNYGWSVAIKRRGNHYINMSSAIQQLVDVDGFLP